MSFQEENQLIKWLRDDYRKLREAVDELTVIVSELRTGVQSQKQPCKDLEIHLAYHKKTENRIWNAFTRIGYPLVVAALMALLFSKY